MKTAIQELIEWLKDENSEGSLGDKVLGLLELEKDQIINAFITGDRSDCLTDQDSKSYAEQYYQVRFGDNPEAGI